MAKQPPKQDRPPTPEEVEAFTTARDALWVGDTAGAVLVKMVQAFRDKQVLTLTADESGAMAETFIATRQCADSAECVVRQVARDTFGEDMTVEEYADRAGYDS